MAHWLKVLAAFPGDSSSVPSTYIMVIPSCLLPSARVSDALFWPTQEMHPRHSQTYTHTHKVKTVSLKKKYKTYLENLKKKNQVTNRGRNIRIVSDVLSAIPKANKSLELLHFKARKQIIANQHCFF